MIGLDGALTDVGREITGLGLMPRTEIAVMDKGLRVLVYLGMSRVIMQGGALFRAFVEKLSGTLSLAIETTT